MKIENLSGIAKRIIDFFFRPHIERAFGCLVVAVSARGYRAVGVFG